MFCNYPTVKVRPGRGVLCCVRSAHFCCVCVGQVDFLTNEADMKAFSTESRENMRREGEKKEKEGGEGGETYPKSLQIFEGGYRL